MRATSDGSSVPRSPFVLFLDRVPSGARDGRAPAPGTTPDRRLTGPMIDRRFVPALKSAARWRASASAHRLPDPSAHSGGLTVRSSEHPPSRPARPDRMLRLRLSKIRCRRRSAKKNQFWEIDSRSRLDEHDAGCTPERLRSSFSFSFRRSSRLLVTDILRISI